MSARPLKFILVAGARPNFMKVAPLIKAAAAHNAAVGDTGRQVEYCLVHTGQHYDEKMSDVFFRDLGIPAPHVNLEVGSGSHAVQTANTMIRFEPVCLEQKPDWVVVVGDVNPTVACTLVAAKLGIPVAHVEAGLRSFDRSMPEELNRLVTDSIADLLLTPSAEGDENLAREGVPPHRIRMVGNIMIDSVVARAAATNGGEPILDRLGLSRRGFIYVTLHRPSNVDDRETLTVIVRELSAIAQQWPIVFPIHPRTLKRMEEFGLSFTDHPNLQLIEPVGYNDSLALTEHARCLLTDSGGLQEESTYFRTPCLTLRPNTERPITVTVGSNRLTNPERLRDDLKTTLDGPERTGATPPLWDGHTAQRIINILLEQ
jgi:UDP-N-acetylglucosamine 2-epimerase (non-hydrolysing)